MQPHPAAECSCSCSPGSCLWDLGVAAVPAASIRLVAVAGYVAAAAADDVVVVGAAADDSADCPGTCSVASAGCAVGSKSGM